MNALQSPIPPSLTDRASAADVVTAYAMALDARDWARFRCLFEDVIEIDYSSLGSISAELPADEWAARCGVLGMFDATQHKVSNFGYVFDGERAAVTSYVDAAHFIAVDGEVLEAFAQGIYIHTLNRAGESWKIARCEFRLIGCPGGRAAFDKAFSAARERFAARQPL